MAANRSAGQAPVAVAAAFAAVAASLAAAGCGDGGPGPGTDAALRQRATVRLDALLARHPLQDDVRRLDEAAARLRRAAGAVSVGAVQAGGVGYGLPALGAVGPAGGDPAQLSLLAQRRGAARARFAARAEQGIEEYEAAQEFRRQRRREQRRAELTAIAEGRVAEQERAVREQADARAQRALLSTGEYFVRLRAYLDAMAVNLDGQNLASARRIPREEVEAQIPRVTPPNLPPLDGLGALGPEVMDRKVAELEAEKQAIREAWRGVTASDRARFTVALRRMQARLEELEAAEERVAREARSDAEERVAELRRTAAAEVEAQLLALREQFRANNSVLRDRINIGLTLGLERDAAEAARRTLREEAGATTLASAATVEARPPSVMAAALRIEQQKARLRALLRAEVIDAVKDAAAARDIEVTFNGNGGDGGMDRTSDFLNWTGLAQGRLSPVAAATDGGTPRDSGSGGGGRGQ